MGADDGLARCMQCHRDSPFGVGPGEYIREAYVPEGERIITTKYSKVPVTEHKAEAVTDGETEREIEFPVALFRGGMAYGSWRENEFAVVFAAPEHALIEA